MSSGNVVPCHPKDQEILETDESRTAMAVHMYGSPGFSDGEPSSFEDYIFGGVIVDRETYRSPLRLVQTEDDAPCFFC